ncbi:MAG: DUF1194 domain-containing protein [Xanthobacteraceae bacterium]|nr:DUF1194 domain-containing protein [Xanthobacteraceae bacterium]
MSRPLRRLLFLAIAAIALTPASITIPAPADERMPVDIELVLAVDVSYSMDTDEQALQREGYISALTSSEFLDALRKGAHGRIAVTYVEWAGFSDQKVIIPWQLIDGRASAEAFASRLAEAPIRRAYRTSISGALLFSAGLFQNSGFKGIRRVIDVSGDGTNNQGDLIEPTRDDVIAKGITINGLPIILKTPNTSMIDIPDLELYYEDCVIGGPGAFMVPARERSQFAAAIRNKLVLEVAGMTPRERSLIVPVVSPPRISCTIGERMWQQRWGGGG